MTCLDIAPGLELPLEAITQTFVVLAKRGSGKTYTGNVMAEEMIGAGHPVVVIDPVGVWWGLRSSADGTCAGLPVAIFGGDHADVPLDENAGAVIADAIVAERFPAILDLSLLSKSAARRFMTAFLERLYHRNRDPLHIFIDEADAFAPQRAADGGQRLLGAMEDLVRRGRARGIGCTLITQRPAVLHKDVLSQAEVLICLRMTGVRDVAAIDEWIKLHDVDAQAAEVKQSLPSLPIGTAWVWSPGWLERLDKVQIRIRTTFDSSATPKIGQTRIVPKQMADIDLAALGQKIASTAEDVKANDPKSLKARIAKLETELSAATMASAMSIREVEVSVLTDIDRTMMRESADKLAAALEAATSASAGMHAATRDLIDHWREKTDAVSMPRPGEVKVEKVRTAAPVLPPQPRQAQPRGDAPALGKAQRMILGVLAQSGPRSVVQVALLSGYSSKSSGFKNSVSSLRTSGLIIGGRDQIQITPEGVDAVGDVEPLPTGEALLDHWRANLGKAERLIFDALIEAYPEPRSADELAELTGYSAASSGFKNSLSRLRTFQLAVGGRDGVVIADELGQAR